MLMDLVYFSTGSLQVFHPHWGGFCERDEFMPGPGYLTSFDHGRRRSTYSFSRPFPARSAAVYTSPRGTLCLSAISAQASYSGMACTGRPSSSLILTGTSPKGVVTVRICAAPCSGIPAARACPSVLVSARIRRARAGLVFAAGYHPKQRSRAGSSSYRSG